MQGSSAESYMKCQLLSRITQDAQKYYVPRIGQIQWCQGKNDYLDSSVARMSQHGTLICLCSADKKGKRHVDESGI